MEKILRSKEMAEIVLLPVRHHSPACSFHVRKVIEEYHPSIILIEGPENANELIPVMVHRDTQAPFAIYYSYYDKAGLLSEEKEHYKCYYPFLDYSPELAALHTAAEFGIPAAFMDLSYGDILAASKEGAGLRKKEEKNNYNDDYLLSRNAYVKKLCEKANLRSFDEFWEKYFEIDGLSKDSDAWFSDLLLYCRQARESTPEEVLQDEGSLAREAHMAEVILQAAAGNFTETSPQKTAGSVQSSVSDMQITDKNGVSSMPLRILAVTGGFHTPALSALLRESSPKDSSFQMSSPNDFPAGTSSPDHSAFQVSASNKSAASGRKKTAKKIKDQDQNVYLMPYSMEAADALNGYASGMPYPAFYQKVWDKFSEVPDNCYRQTVLDLLVSCGKEVRRKEGNLSTYDEICAVRMADGLSALRGKNQPGAYELFDAVLSSYVKGEYTIATNAPMLILRKHMTGSAVGKLCSQAQVPPIIQDFEAQCRQFSLKTGSTLETEVTLSLFSSDKHRRESCFFHRMLFLNTYYARRVKGPNLQQQKDRNLIREIWRYKWNTQVNAALIDVSVYGATIEEAAGSLVKEELKKEIGAGACAILLTRVFEMSLKEHLQNVYDRAQELIRQDTDFYSLADALSHFKMMRELASLYRSKLDFDLLMDLTIRKLISLLPSMATVKEEDLGRCMDAIKLLYQLTEEDTQEEFFEILTRMQKDTQIQAGLDGCIHGILYGGGREDASSIEHAALGYVQGTKEQMKKTALFFRGLFFSARDLIFIGGQILNMLDAFLQQTENEEFMELLPELRMAFTYFTPREIDKIAEKAASLHGRSGKDITRLKEIPPDWYAYGKELDTHIGQRINGDIV